MQLGRLDKKNKRDARQDKSNRTQHRRRQLIKTYPDKDKVRAPYHCKQDGQEKMREFHNCDSIIIILGNFNICYNQ